MDKRVKGTFRGADTTDPAFWQNRGSLNDVEGSESDDSYKDGVIYDEDSAYDKESDGFVQEEEEKTFIELFRSLPDGLFRVVVQQLAMAFLALVAGIFIIITLKSAQAIILMVAAGWLAWLGISIIYDYASGKIIERPLLCASVQRTLHFQNRTRVVFRTQEDIPSYFEFFIPGRKVRYFSENYAYIIYVRESNPRVMLGFQPL